MKGQQIVGREEGLSWLMAQPSSSALVTELLTTQPCSVRARFHIRQPLAGICVPQTLRGWCKHLATCSAYMSIGVVLKKRQPWSFGSCAP